MTGSRSSARARWLVVATGVLGVLALWRLGGSGGREPESTEPGSDSDGRHISFVHAPPSHVASAAIEGTVVAADGAIALDAVVLASEIGASSEHLSDQHVVAVGAQGRFRIESLRPGVYELTASSPSAGTGHLLLELLPGEERTGLVVHLEESPLLIRGRVSDEGGGPVVGALVLAMGAGETLTRRTAAFTDEQGRYSVAVARRSHLVVAHADGYVPSRRFVTAEHAEGVDFVLDPASALRGQVVRAEDGAPVEGARVTVTSRSHRLERTTTSGPTLKPSQRL